MTENGSGLTLGWSGTPQCIKRIEKESGRVGRSQEELGGILKSQESLGESGEEGRSQEAMERVRGGLRHLVELGVVQRRHTISGGAMMSQQASGGVRRRKEESGGAWIRGPTCDDL